MKDHHIAGLVAFLFLVVAMFVATMPEDTFEDCTTVNPTAEMRCN